MRLFKTLQRVEAVRGIAWPDYGKKMRAWRSQVDFMSANSSTTASILGCQALQLRNDATIGCLGLVFIPQGIFLSPPGHLMNLHHDCYTDIKVA